MPEKYNTLLLVCTLTKTPMTNYALTLNDLPPPPEGRSGWPWTEEGPRMPGTMPDGSPWPPVSIVTPSFNQGEFLEETMRSVLLQGYPNLEYIIIDGGSSDNTLDIIHKYEPCLAYWVSEPDRGQGHAINKGFDKANGQIFAWINSDDYYYPAVIFPVTHIFARDTNIGLVHAYEAYVGPDSTLIHNTYPCFRNAKATTLYSGSTLLQLTCFWRSYCFRAVGGLDERLHYHMDYDLFLKLSYRYPSTYLQKCIGAFRRYPGQKTGPRNIERVREYKNVLERFLARQGICSWKNYLMRMIFSRYCRTRKFWPSHISALRYLFLSSRTVPSHKKANTGLRE